MLNAEGGMCAAKNMRLKIFVAPDNSTDAETRQIQKSSTKAQRILYDTIHSHDDEYLDGPEKHLLRRHKFWRPDKLEQNFDDMNSNRAIDQIYEKDNHGKDESSVVSIDASLNFPSYGQHSEYSQNIEPTLNDGDVDQGKLIMYEVHEGENLLILYHITYAGESF